MRPNSEQSGFISKFKDESVNSDDFKHFNLIHSESAFTRQHLIPSKACSAGVSAPQIREIAGRTLQRIIDVQIATIPECRTVTITAINGIRFVLLLENLRRQIVRILDRENKTGQTPIRNITTLRTPGKWRNLRKCSRSGSRSNRQFSDVHRICLERHLLESHRVIRDTKAGVSYTRKLRRSRGAVEMIFESIGGRASNRPGIF
jgi:hypothetical protein